MATFSQAAGAIVRARKPAAIVVLEPSAWCDEWADKPSASVAVGLRCLADESTTSIQAEAVKQARAAHPDAHHDDPNLIDAFNDALMRLAVARATCDPNDATVSYFGMPEDEVPEAWLPGTIRRLWDELERATIANSPVRIPATDEDLVELQELLAGGLVGKLVTSQELRMRKLLGFALEELRAVRDAGL